MDTAKMIPVQRSIYRSSFGEYESMKTLMKEVAEQEMKRSQEQNNPYRNITADLDSLNGISPAKGSGPMYSVNAGPTKFSTISVSNYKPVKEPTFRSGRLGGPWRHIQACYSNTGSHLCFVNGSVKLDDCNAYPPFGYPDIASQWVNSANPYAPPNQSGRRSAPLIASSYMNVSKQGSGDGKNLSTSYNQRARENFKYWHEEKKYEGLPAKHTIRGRMIAKGVPLP